MTDSISAARKVYLLPGWQNSGSEHWQSRWEALYGWHRVEQADWLLPRRGDWMSRLDEVLLDTTTATDPPAVLVAHSLGCQLIAAWAAQSQHTARVGAALLVAPPDLDREEMPGVLQAWRPMARQPLPFRSLVVASRDDPYCAYERAQGLARDWGAGFIDAGRGGHLNSDSGLGEWPQGHAWLTALVEPDASSTPPAQA